MQKETIGHLNYAVPQIVGLTFLRILTGWHFLYEGLMKVYTPDWSAENYLAGSSGPFAPLFRSIVRSDLLLSLVNALNIWGLVLVGLSLFTGFFSRTGSLLGMLLLLLYYFAYPPFGVYATHLNAEGSYWIVNKNLVEAAALWVLYLFPTGHITGVEHFCRKQTQNGRG